MIGGSGDGDLEDRDLQRLAHLQALLRGDAGSVRYLDYRECEAAAETLAARILDRLEGESLDGWAFEPIPRGGLIVLGMISYLLRLEPHQIRMTPGDDRPVVLVDDVAMTGSRLKETVGELSNRRLVVAHLASPEPLRREVEAEDNVAACVAAIDLAVLDDALEPESRERIRASWAERLSGERYWYGHPEMIAFPWTEPDQILWDPHSAQVEAGWRLVSPELVLKSRAALGPPNPDRSSRVLGFPKDIAHGRFDNGLLICRLDTEEVFKLDETGAMVWGALGTLGEIGAAETYLEELTGSERRAVDVESFAGELLEAGLLVRMTRPG